MNLGAKRQKSTSVTHAGRPRVRRSGASEAQRNEPRPRGPLRVALRRLARDRIAPPPPAHSIENTCSATALSLSQLSRALSRLDCVFAVLGRVGSPTGSALWTGSYMGNLPFLAHNRCVDVLEVLRLRERKVSCHFRERARRKIRPPDVDTVSEFRRLFCSKSVEN